MKINSNNEKQQLKRPIKRISLSYLSNNDNFFRCSNLAYKEVGKELNKPERSVVFWLISNMNMSDNTVKATYSEIIKGSQVSRRTVADTLKRLRGLSLIKTKYGIIYINPNWCIDGSKIKQVMLNNIFKEL